MVFGKRIVQATAVTVLALLVGCGGKDSEGGAINTAEKKENTPVEFTFMPHSSISDAQLESFIVEPLKKKYPHITLKIVRQGKTTWEDLLMSGDFPDMWTSPFKETEKFARLGIAENVNSYVAAQKVDINKFEPEAIKTIKGYASNGELFALPYMMNYGVLFYNKDIFDKFGVPYPKDGSTWDDVIELGKRVSRTESGVTYIGLDPSTPSAINVSVGNPVAVGTKAQINTDNWKKLFQMVSRVYEQPGFIEKKMYNYGVGSGAFVNERNVAIIADWSDVLSRLSDMRAKGNPMNWDMATHPNFADNMGKGRDVGAHAYYMYNKSKKKDAVFQAIQYLVDEEAQRIANRQGKLTILTKTDVFKREYGQDVPELQGKNKEAIFKMTPTATVTHEYYSIVGGTLNKATEAIALKQKDLNTALKEAEEEANKLIAEQIAAKK